ncbi:transaldolase [Planktotalea sp.]|uniref:transaldolase n=1 Tax=Planktotalea sp. TaxID=2029877 RepID=UPI00329A3527
MTNVLEKLRSMTTVVADTGDLDAVRRLKPIDCTTNPSLCLKAFDDPASRSLLNAEISKGEAAGHSPAEIANDLPVALGAELSKLVPGRVSTEVDARLSYDTQASVARAHQIIDAYAQRGIDKGRILIKLAATWEGIQAAQILQKEGVDCNLTLIFCLAQAIACADAGAHLISPFVGRITDWHKAANNVSDFTPENDPGVASVREIFNYYKAHGINTIIMGASFRNTGQIKALAGCDNLTISPELLTELAADNSNLSCALDASAVPKTPLLSMPEQAFRWNVAQDRMAHDLLADGIRKFHADYVKIVRRLT